MTRHLQYKGLRAHYVDPHVLWLSGQDKLFLKPAPGQPLRQFGDLALNLLQRMIMRLPLAARLLRYGIQHIVPLSDGSVVVVTGQKIFALDPLGRMRAKPADIKGSRPLCVCEAHGVIYYGEYRKNQHRNPVHIWASKDQGVSWQPVWEFSGIRHIHGVFNDPYTGQLWVSTGDRDQESGIWMSADGFQKVHQIIGGTQQTRAIRLLFTQDHIYFGSDSPVEKNYIYRMDRKGTRVERLQAMPGPVFHGCKVGDHLIFSTAVEPGQVNTTKQAEVWQSVNGEQWRRVDAYQKDSWSMKYFQYGQVFFPEGEGDGQHLYCTPFASRHHHDTFIMDMTKGQH